MVCARICQSHLLAHHQVPTVFKCAHYVNTMKVCTIGIGFGDVPNPSLGTGPGTGPVTYNKLIFTYSKL